MGYQTTDP